MAGRPSQARFAATRWSLVRRARDGDEQGKKALGELCSMYWSPVYAFFRRDGMKDADARDLTQGLFAELLERGDVAGGDPEVGRFRSYLLACARHYRSNARDRERAQKRGGDRRHVPIAVGGENDAETMAVELADEGTPEQVYVRAWVQQTVDLALAELASAEQEKGRAEQFALLRGALEGRDLDHSYAAIAEQVGSTEAAIKVAAHRLRRRFRSALLSQLGATVDDAAEAEAELRELFAALS